MPVTVAVTFDKRIRWLSKSLSRITLIHYVSLKLESCANARMELSAPSISQCLIRPSTLGMLPRRCLTIAAAASARRGPMALAAARVGVRSLHVEATKPSVEVPCSPS